MYICVTILVKNVIFNTKKMKNYKQRFKQLVEELQLHPEVQVLSFCTYPPVPEDTIIQLENKIGATLPSSLRSFYLETNGLHLRWIFKSNEDFDSHKHTYNDQIQDCMYPSQHYLPEDGVVSILPIEKMLDTNWSNELGFEEDLILEGKKYPLVELDKRVKLFDVFNHENAMAFLITDDQEFLVLMASEELTCLSESLVTDIDSYFEFILANKAVLSRRKAFYKKRKKTPISKIETPHSYWTDQKKFDINSAMLKKVFPLADKAGGNTIGIDSQRLHQIARNSLSLSSDVLEEMIQKHYDFLSSGGAGGKWKTLLIDGLVVALYTGAKQTKGEQASFDRRRFDPDISLEGMELPFANFCGAYAKGVNFAQSDFSYSVFTDAMLEGANFSNTNLRNVDFSRAKLNNANFSNANLNGVDFENCDLHGANFLGAKLEAARFPGAILRDVIYKKEASDEH